MADTSFDVFVQMRYRFFCDLIRINEIMSQFTKRFEG